MPPCGNGFVDERFIYFIEKLPNGFVSEHSTDDIPVWNRIDLVHCESGKTMRADFRAVGEHDPRPVDDHFESRMKSPVGITQERLARELKEKGARTQIFVNRAESCACRLHYPQSRGAKSAFEAEF